MNKKELAVLDKIFAAEVEGRLPAQVNSKMLNKLESDGMVARAMVHLPGHFPVAVHGWELTHLGRFTYCESCKEVDA